ncbi:MAG: hypothetical protein MUC50_21825, partial [Myxococcota bacterium]|nr:hypothetical protein [Myxococcota bacterium]
MRKRATERADTLSTFRLTNEEKRLLAVVAESTGITRTDLLRGWLLKNADEIRTGHRGPQQRIIFMLNEAKALQKVLDKIGDLDELAEKLPNVRDIEAIGEAIDLLGDLDELAEKLPNVGDIEAIGEAIDQLGDLDELAEKLPSVRDVEAIGEAIDQL